MIIISLTICFQEELSLTTIGKIDSIEHEENQHGCDTDYDFNYKVRSF